MKRVSFDGMSCSIARSLETVGEWWTPLIVREVFFGRRRFDEIQGDLGISRNILTDRLSTLVDDGVLERRNIAQTGTRWEYHLTEKGRDLFPVLVSLMQWGDKWAVDEKGPPVLFEHRSCGHDADAVYTCSHCGEAIGYGSLKARRGPGWEDDPHHPLAHRDTRPA
jgi:DNA-binding HxlR family transcriptional regulator